MISLELVWWFQYIIDRLKHKLFVYVVECVLRLFSIAMTSHLVHFSREFMSVLVLHLCLFLGKSQVIRQGVEQPVSSSLSHIFLIFRIFAQHFIPYLCVDIYPLSVLMFPLWWVVFEFIILSVDHISYLLYFVTERASIVDSRFSILIPQP